jgi:MFS family permease
VFRAGLVWSAGAYLLCATATSFPALLFCRFLQGVGASLVLSCGVALATGLYGEERRARILGAYTMMFATGSALGPLLGGAMIEAWGWPAVFWFRAPIAITALLLLRAMPVPPAGPARERFDLAGAFLLALGLAAALLALNQLPGLAALPLALVAAAAFAGFVWHEGRAAAPILDLGVFRVPGFALLNLANVLTNLAGFAVWLLVPFYLARMTGLTLVGSGAVLGAAWAAAIAAAPLGGRLIGHVRPERLTQAGAALVGLGLLLAGFWDADTGPAVLVGALMVQGLGLGLFQVAYTEIVTAAIPRRNRGVAGSLSLMTRTVGTVGATAVVMLVFQSLEPGAGFLGAFQSTLRIAAVLPFLTALALALPRRQ